MRFHPILHYWRLHAGRDFAADCGTPVRAAAAGRVISAGGAGGYGNRIVVDHGILRGVDLATAYNHLSRFAVHGGRCRAARSSATSGTTGTSTGCHLHFETYEDGIPRTRAAGSERRDPYRGAAATAGRPGARTVARTARGTGTRDGTGNRRGQGTGSQGGGEQPQGAPRLPHRGHLRGGLVLIGTEVKSLREGRASLIDGYAAWRGDELWLEGVHIPEYVNGTWTNHAPRRRRKLLLHRAEIDQDRRRKSSREGHTIVPLQLYFKDGRAKVEIAHRQGQEAVRQAAGAARAAGHPRHHAGAHVRGER